MASVELIRAAELRDLKTPLSAETSTPLASDTFCGRVREIHRPIELPSRQDQGQSDQHQQKRAEALGIA